MSSSFKPMIQAYKADSAIAKGKAVKIGTDRQHVNDCSANTDKAIGIAQNAADAAEDIVEVAMPGGGAKGLLGESVSAGQLLVPHTDGSLVIPNALGDHIIAQALESGVAGDLIAVSVVVGKASAAE